MNSNSKKVSYLVAGLALLSLFSLASCGDTSDGAVDYTGTTFVAGDDTTGTISLNLSSSTIAADSETLFSVQLRDSLGGPVPGATVFCRGESGSGILVSDPQFGIGLTDSFGDMSGALLCANPGSHQFICELLGTSRQVLATLRCT
jgi:hypothetical protein